MCRVVEAYHQRGDIHPVGHALVIAPGFAQRVRAVVTLELNGLAPGLDPVVDAGDLQRLPALLAFEQVFPRVVALLFKQVPDGLNTSPVQDEPPGFTGFLFVDFDGIPWFKISDLVNPKPKQIRGP